jgi:hypothetical protein
MFDLVYKYLKTCSMLLKPEAMIFNKICYQFRVQLLIYLNKEKKVWDK